MDEHGHPQGEFPGRTEPGYEVRDVNVRAIVGFGISLIVCMIVVMGLMAFLMGSLAPHRGAVPPELAPTNVAQELKRLRADEERTLTSYGKVAGEPEFAHIPIDRAMDLMVKQGVPFGKGRKTEVEINSRAKP